MMMKKSTGFLMTKKIFINLLRFAKGPPKSRVGRKKKVGQCRRNEKGQKQNVSFASLSVRTTARS